MSITLRHYVVEWFVAQWRLTDTTVLMLPCAVSLLLTNAIISQSEENAYFTFKTFHVCARIIFIFNHHHASMVGRPQSTSNSSLVPLSWNLLPLHTYTQEQRCMHFYPHLNCCMRTIVINLGMLRNSISYSKTILRNQMARQNWVEFLLLFPEPSKPDFSFSFSLWYIL